jgi:membrane protease YdiL (CAAX protease family)
MEIREQDRRLLILAVLSSIFLLNDELFMRAKGYGEWLAIDYGSRFLAIGIVLYLLVNNISLPSEFGLARIPFRKGLQWALLLSVSGILIDQVGWRFLEKILPDTQLVVMPKIGNSLIKTFDLTFGVALVAVSEEIVFRGYCYSVLKGRMSSHLLVTVSVLLFGLIHWSTGLHAIVSTALWGVLPMVAMIRTGSVIPAIIAHYLTDLVSLGGFVPETWFHFIK